MIPYTKALWSTSLKVYCLSWYPQYSIWIKFIDVVFEVGMFRGIISCHKFVVNTPIQLLQAKNCISEQFRDISWLKIWILVNNVPQVKSRPLELFTTSWSRKHVFGTNLSYVPKMDYFFLPCAARFKSAQIFLQL